MPTAFTRLTKVKFKHNGRVIEGVVSVNWLSLSHGTVCHVVEWAGTMKGEINMAIKSYSQLEEINGTTQKDGKALTS